MKSISARRIHEQMMKRCYNPKQVKYYAYGARGITVDPHWHSYANFIADMGPRPSPDHTIERKDVNGPYCKLNCIWLLQRLQGRNTTRNKLKQEDIGDIMHDMAIGIPRAALARKYNVSEQMVKYVYEGKRWAHHERVPSMPRIYKRSDYATGGRPKPRAARRISSAANL